LLAALAGYALHFLLPHPAGRADGARAPAVDPVLESFWGPFFGSGTPTIVAYTNPVFLVAEPGVLIRYTGPHSGPTGTYVSASPDLKPYISPKALPFAKGPLHYNATFTATGEVQAVHRLTKLFSSGGGDLEVKPSRRLRTDEFRQHDVIFLGSPYGNEILEEVCGRQNFSFHEGRILNNGPRAGEPSFYTVQRNEATGVLQTDYALVSMLPSLTSQTRILVLAGIWTQGTLAAAQFATSVEGINSLKERFGGRLPPFFQAVVRAEILKDQVSRINLVTVREVTQKKYETAARNR